MEIKNHFLDLSHKPLSDHPKKLKTTVINKVLNLHRRNPDCSFIELWVRLKYEAIKISPSSVL